MTLVCSDCPTPITARSKGRCRSCSVRVKWSAASRAKLSATKRAYWAAQNATVEGRANLAARAKAMRHVQVATPALVAKQQAGRDRSFWCPEGYRALNRELRRKKMTLAERKQMIATAMLDDSLRRQRNQDVERVRIAALSSFDRQMELVRNGAKLVERFVVPSRQYDYTIAGGSPL